MPVGAGGFRVRVRTVDHGAECVDKPLKREVRDTDRDATRPVEQTCGTSQAVAGWSVPSRVACFMQCLRYPWASTVLSRSFKLSAGQHLLSRIRDSYRLSRQQCLLLEVSKYRKSSIGSYIALIAVFLLLTAVSLHFHPSSRACGR